MKTTNIGIWGDSITYGAWEADGGWADRLRRFLHEKEIESRFEEYYWVYNLGIPGETSADILKRFATEAAARTPNLAIFAVGVNDCCCKGAAKAPRVPIEAYRDNMRALIREARRYAKDIVCVGLVLVDESITEPFNGEDAWFTYANVLAYNSALEEVATEEGALFADMLNVLAQEDLYDGLHPNVEGHRKMYEYIRDFLFARDVLT